MQVARSSTGLYSLQSPVVVCAVWAGTVVTLLCTESSFCP